MSKKSDMWDHLGSPDWKNLVDRDAVIEHVFYSVAYRGYGSIFVIPSYIFEEIADKLVDERVMGNVGHEEIRRKFQKLKKPCLRKELSRSWLRSKLAGEESPTCHDSIVLMDPGETHSIQEVCPPDDSELAYIVFEHGIEVSLGIGFSLVAFRQLLKGRKWRRALDAADLAFSKLKIEDIYRLSDLGISLDLGVLPRTRAAITQGDPELGYPVVKQD